MYTHEQGVGERLEALTFDGTQEYGHLVATIEAASERMADKTEHKTLSSFLSSSTGVHLDDHGYSENVFLTDQAEKLPFPKRVFHVTGGTALNALQNDMKLVPTDAHYLGDVQTDKGILVHIIPAFMETLGVGVGNLQQFLFSGPQVDAEQIAHFNQNAGRNISHEGTSILMQPKDHDYVLSDDLRTILTALDKGIKPIDHEPLRKTVDGFIAKMFEVPNIREGWLDRIRNILYGLEPYHREGHDTSIAKRVEDRLQTELYMHRKLKNTMANPAVVLEIDTDSLVKQTSSDSLFPVLVGSRPIESIFPSIAITPGSIVNAYAAPEHRHNLSGGRIKVKSLDDLGRDVWLGGVHWRDANPNMEAPLCAIRYTQGKHTTWWDAVQSGMLAPAKTIEQKALFTPPMALTDIFGRGKFRFTGSQNFQKFPRVFEHVIETKFPFINGVFNRLDW